ncbi:XrtA system polysaccharide deacetylase [Salinisphaera sp. Q1T1-3]|uniref:XrtA system polysaccharide deacetylase n=1 Tax=Salinisphaera sp. Q1T1-3 TaxID=2321229 RepID=UPI000E74E911|nr:XrtA system polysaccharide deacetylase [Salinisphaera sp. Q1T1-3]RJS94719.1 DUF3473 domain-containing protein [Salinisphaera sp. Q1T1-3]
MNEPDFDPQPLALDSGRGNAMTVDVEEYFHVSAFEDHIDPREWATMPSRVEASTDRILSLFEAAGVKATFFTLGWVAERQPALVRRIVDAGHELASHGQNHARAFQQEPAAFVADITRAKDVLEQAGGVAVRGYRAPSFSIDRRNLWAFDALAEAGYTYSSSVFPGHHTAYGMPDAPRFAFRHRPGGLLEIPITTADLGLRRLPCAGGGFFRLYPYALTRRLLERVTRAEGQAAIFYFHPWEIDPDQPRISGLALRTRVRQYLNLSRVESRLERLLRAFTWDRMDRIFPVDAPPETASA